jgi:hypothetical protein
MLQDDALAHGTRRLVETVGKFADPADRLLPPCPIRAAPLAWSQAAKVIATACRDSHWDTSHAASPPHGRPENAILLGLVQLEWLLGSTPDRHRTAI